jgi:hypothetical protein
MHGPTTDPIDEAPGTDDADDEEFARETRRVIALGLLELGIDACTICGEAHRPTQCPKVTAEWLRQAAKAEAKAEAERRQMIADWADMLREAYEAMPVWMEAA